MTENTPVLAHILKISMVRGLVGNIQSNAPVITGVTFLSDDSILGR